MVHRPGAQAPSSSQGTPGLLPNGVFDPGSSQQQQQGAQQFAVQPGTANSQMLLSAYPGAQGMQAASGMIPTPNLGAGDGTELVFVKPEPDSSANGVPLEGAADPSSSFQRSSLPGVMGASPGLGGSNGMGTTLMSNGAPVLIKQDAWSMPSPSMVPVRVLLRLIPVAMLTAARRLLGVFPSAEGESGTVHLVSKLQPDARLPAVLCSCPAADCWWRGRQRWSHR